MLSVGRPSKKGQLKVRESDWESESVTVSMGGVSALRRSGKERKKSSSVAT